MVQTFSWTVPSSALGMTFRPASYSTTPRESVVPGGCGFKCFAVCFLLTKVFTWIFWTFCTWELYAFRQFETLTTCWEMAPRWLVFTYIILVFSFETLRSQHISIRAHSALVEGLHSSTMFNSEACSDLTADSKSKVSHLTHLFANQKGNSNKSNVQNMLWMTKVISEPWKFYSPKRILPHTFWQSWSWCIWFVLFN